MQYKVNFNYVGTWKNGEKAVLEMLAATIRNAWCGVINPHLEEMNEEWDRRIGWENTTEDSQDAYNRFMVDYMRRYDTSFVMACRQYELPFTMVHSMKVDGEGVFVPIDDVDGEKYCYITLEEF